jgi:hypothetical protein
MMWEEAPTPLLPIPINVEIYLPIRVVQTETKIYAIMLQIKL